MFNIDEILKLKEAGFEDSTILSLVEKSNVKENEKSIENAAASITIPSDLPEEGKPQVETKEPSMEDLKAEFKGIVNDAIQEFRKTNINQSQQPASETVDDILAGIIRPAR